MKHQGGQIFHKEYGGTVWGEYRGVGPTLNIRIHWLATNEKGPVLTGPRLHTCKTNFSRSHEAAEWVVAAGVKNDHA